MNNVPQPQKGGFWDAWNQLEPSERQALLEQVQWSDHTGRLRRYLPNDIATLSNSEFGKINGTIRDGIQRRVSEILEQFLSSGNPEV